MEITGHRSNMALASRSSVRAAASLTSRAWMSGESVRPLVKVVPFHPVAMHHSPRSLKPIHVVYRNNDHRNDAPIVPVKSDTDPEYPNAVDASKFTAFASR